MPPRFKPLPPAAFRSENGCVSGVDEPGVPNGDETGRSLDTAMRSTYGYIATQGHKYAPERACEDIICTRRVHDGSYIICVCDGHAGSSAAVFAAETLLEAAAGLLRETHNDIEELAGKTGVMDTVHTTHASQG